MNEQNGNTVQSSAMPDQYDRQLAQLHGLPDVTRTKPTTQRVIPPLGVGGSQMFHVQTYRQANIGDVIFLECVSAAGTVRLVIPPPVAAAIARQRDALTAKVRSKAASAVAADRKARGLQPGFMLTGRQVKALKKRVK